MKLKTLVSAIAAVGALASAQGAFATLTPASVPTLNVYVSGATAQDAQFRKLAANLCDAASAGNGNDQLIYLAKGTAIPDSAQQAYMCRMSSAKVPGLPASPGIVVAVYKRSEGGSGWGVGPVASGEPIEFLNKSTCPGAATGTLTESAVVYNIFGNCSGTAQVAPDAGISDVEPKMFKSPNLIDASYPENTDIPAGSPGTVAISNADIGKLVVNALNVTTFGIPVTLDLYRALQTIQGKTLDDRVENMPSLSREQVASFMAGGVADWSNLTVKSGASNVAMTAFPGVVAPSSTKVEICRRSPGSGTQAQYNALFHNSACSASAVDPLNDNTEFTSRLKGSVFGDGDWSLIGLEEGRDGVLPTAPAVHEGQGSGDVTDCLDRLEDNGVWGLGIQSLEKGSAKWRFVKLNGVAPTLENVAKNNYFDWAVGTMQWRNVASGGPAAGSQKLAVLTAIKNETNQVSILQQINSGFNSRITVADGTGYTVAPADGVADKAPVGILALRTSTTNPTAPFSYLNPVMTAVREKGGNPDTCATATVKATGSQKTELDVNTDN
jgi:hypothetical protein